VKYLIEKWRGQTTSAQIGMAVGVTLITAFIIALTVWVYRPDYQVLFADLAPRDAAAMTTELERMKVPYQLGDNGNTLLVPKDIVHKTRLKLMGKNLGLHGVVGFEIFNNVDFGMTEFVQKVNYQRAIQGELTRTILSLEEIQDARVHLAIPEQGLFKKVAVKPKASITLTMKPGKALTIDQIGGIQRLVAASVPDIVAEDVTVLDQHGVALTRIASGEGVMSSTMMPLDTQLDSKRGTEDYFLHKITQVLDRTLGVGEAIASVDVALNHDQSRTTTEEVLPAKTGTQEGSPTGVVVRERQTMRESGANIASIESASSGKSPAAIASVESDYQVGKRVEQVIMASGSLRRMTIAVVVKKPLDQAQVDQIKEVVSLAAGLNVLRGDAIVVHSMDKFKNASAEAVQLADAVPRGDVTHRFEASKAGQSNVISYAQVMEKIAPGFVAFLLFFVVVAGALYFLIRNKRRSGSKQLSVSHLSPSEREKILFHVRQWINSQASYQEIGGARQ